MALRLHGKIAAAAASVAASLIVTGAPATAQQGAIIVQGYGPDTRVERIGYYDLNLATRYGEQTLYRRVGGAVERVCLYDKGRWYGLAVPDYNQCAERSWRGARPQVIGAAYSAPRPGDGRGYWGLLDGASS